MNATYTTTHENKIATFATAIQARKHAEQTLRAARRIGLTSPAIVEG